MDTKSVKVGGSQFFLQESVGPNSVKNKSFAFFKINIDVIAQALSTNQNKSCLLLSSAEIVLKFLGQRM